MGTRADFYIKEGARVEWLGSVAWDGYIWALDDNCELMKSRTKEEFAAAIEREISCRDDFTHPRMGWPWPWKDSHTTDYSYLFSGGEVSVWIFGEKCEGGGECGEVADWMPEMDSSRAVMGGQRSGLIIISG